MEAAEAYVAPGQPPIALICEHRALHITWPERDKQRKDYAFITKCRRELTAAVPKNRGPKINNWAI